MSDVDPQVLRALGPVIAEGIREGVRKASQESLAASAYSGLVQALDLDKGTADVIIDGDTEPSTVLLVGVPPATGSRALVLFVPPQGAYLVGGIGQVRVRLPDTADVTLDGDDHPFQIGGDDQPNLAMDGNELQARDDGSPAVLYLNNTTPAGGLPAAVQLGGRWRAGAADDDPSSAATLARSSNFTGAEFALRQQADGDTILNCAPDGTVFVLNGGAGASVARFGLTAAAEGDIRFGRDVPTDGAAAGYGLFLRNDGTGQVFRLSSTGADKQVIGPADLDELATLLGEVRLVEYTRPRTPTPSRVEVGLIAEDAPAALQIIDQDGRAADVNRDLLLMALVAQVQRLTARLESLA